MIALLIARFQYLFAQPQSRGDVYRITLLWYTHRHEIEPSEPDMRQILSRSGFWKAKKLLSGLGWSRQVHRAKPGLGIESA
jgi:hypothetical protein